MVLWFKDGNPLPIYSYDAREFTKKRWSEDKMFGARATFRDTVSPAQLRIDRLGRTDAGVVQLYFTFFLNSDHFQENTRVVLISALAPR